MQQININGSDLLVTQRLPNDSGYTWTLASRLGDMLHVRAEELFGPRDPILHYPRYRIRMADGPSNLVS